MRFHASIERKIWDKLVDRFSPSYLEVVNESSQHSVPEGSETHFRVIIVSEFFKSLARVQRSRYVHELLADELAGGVHALSTKEYTPEEWQAKGGKVPPSPPCLGGSLAGKK